MPRPLLAVLFAACLLAGCADAEDLVRQARLQPDPSVTVAEALERYPYFTGITWSSAEGKDGKRIVEAACTLDLAANCRQVSQDSLALARRDVRRDLLVARFLVDGLPRKVIALEAMHVTECSNGTRLRLADPKFLAAVYARERIPFFCLEGLNCPGQKETAQP